MRDRDITDAAADGSSWHGYLVEPDEVAGMPLILIQEWWGLTDQIRAVAREYAAAGHLVLAPDLYGGRIAHDAEEAAEWMEKLPVDEAVSLLGGAIGRLQREAGDATPVGVIGYCMGGSFALVMAAMRPGDVGAAVAYYPVGPYELSDMSEVRCPVLAHFGEQDPWATPEDAEALVAALADGSAHGHRIIVHPDAGHGFESPGGDAAQRALAAQSRRTTLEFLHQANQGGLE